MKFNTGHDIKVVLKQFVFNSLSLSLLLKDIWMAVNCLVVQKYMFHWDIVFLQ